MTVGKSGEVHLICGGVLDLTVTAVWEEWVDASANTSRIAVTGMTVTAEETGTYTLSGTVSMDGAVIGRLSDCMVQVWEVGVPSEVMGDCFPVVGNAVSHKEHDAAVLTMQLAGQTPKDRRYYASGRISAVLTVQPRISQVGASNPLMGRPMMIVIGSADSRALHTLRYEFAGTRGVIGTELSDGAHSWVPPMELCALIPHSEREPCTILCDTYMDGALMGTASCTPDLIVPIGVGLTLEDGWVTLEPANEGTAVDGMDCCVQGLSRVRAVFDESKIHTDQAYGAVPTGFEMAVGGVECDETFVSEVLHSSGSIPVTCGVSDSRGRRYRVQSEVTVLPYTPPALGDVMVFRCDGDGTSNERGNSLSVSVSHGICALGGRNHGTVTARVRTVGGAWSEAVTLTDASPTVLWSGEISPNDSYEVLAEVRDVPGRSASVTVMLPCTNVFFQGRREGRGAAFGKHAEADDVLEVAWSLKTKGDLVVEGSATIGGKQLWEYLYPVGTVCSCTASADPGTLFGGTWAAAESDVCHWVRTA